ncbi:MAG TPA: hypothetical protein VFG06_05530 [Thermodesulfovibrionales bacterium]|nr:hypothetical protein [Thermodesulfovibrionales bacterium]
MDKSDNTEVIAIESDSRPGAYYSVNMRLLTCSCPHFYKKLRGLSLNDPHSLCKHLVKALSINGIPEHLKQYRKDIDWFAQHNSAFTSREQAIKSKKWDKNIPLPDGSITTTKSGKKKKYYYLEGTGDEKKILASLPLAGGVVSFTINNFHGDYDLKTQARHIPWNYRYMEQALINWIVDEYNKTKNAGAPMAAKKTIIYKLNPDPIAEGSIKTFTTEKVDISSGFLELPDGLMYAVDENEKYCHVIGGVENYKIDAFISSASTLLYYSINGSRIYSFDIVPSSTESAINLSEVGVKSPFKSVITIDTSDKFPKNYHFMEKAVIKWLTDEYNKIKLRSIVQHDNQPDRE